MKYLFFLLILFSLSAFSQNDCILLLTTTSGNLIAVGVGEIRYVYEENGNAILVQSNKLTRYKVQESLDSVQVLAGSGFFSITDRVTGLEKLINKRYVQNIVNTSGSKALITMDVGGFTSTESFTTIKGRADDCSNGGESGGNGIFSVANLSSVIPDGMSPEVANGGTFGFGYNGGNSALTIDDSNGSIILQSENGGANFVVADVMNATINDGGAFYIDDNRTGGSDAGVQYLTNPTGLTSTSLVPKAYVDVLGLNQIKGSGSAPSIVANTNAGTGATVAVTSAESSNSAGRFTLTTGSGSVAIGTWVTVTFANAYSVIPVVQIFADRTKSDVGGNNAATLLGDYGASVNVTLTGFSLHVNVDPSALTSARHDFNYLTIVAK